MRVATGGAAGTRRWSPSHGSRRAGDGPGQVVRGRLARVLGLAQRDFVRDAARSEQREQRERDEPEERDAQRLELRVDVDPRELVARPLRSDRRLRAICGDARRGDDLDALCGAPRSRASGPRRGARSPPPRDANDVASAPIRIEPISAVPSDDPRFWKTPCRPPTSLVSFSVTADMFTFPSCDASRPSAAPAVNMPMPNSQPDSSGSTAPSSSTALATRIHCAISTMRRGDQRADSRVPTAEKRISETESGKIRMPVCSASRPERHLQVDGHHEEQARRDRVLRPEHAQAAAQPPDRQQVDVHQRLAAGLDELSLAAEEQRQQHEPEGDEPRRVARSRAAASARRR